MFRSQFMNGYFDYEALIEQVRINSLKPEISFEDVKKVVWSNNNQQDNNHQKVLPMFGLLLLPHEIETGEIIKKIIKDNSLYRDNLPLYLEHTNKKNNGYLRAFLWNWDKSFEEFYGNKPIENKGNVHEVVRVSDDESYRDYKRFLRCWVKSIVGTVLSPGGNIGREQLVKCWESPLCNLYRDQLSYEIINKRSKWPYKEVLIQRPHEFVNTKSSKKVLSQESTGEKLPTAIPQKVSIENSPWSLPYRGVVITESFLHDLSLKKAEKGVVYRKKLESLLSIETESLMVLCSRGLITYPQDPLVGASIVRKLLEKDSIGELLSNQSGRVILGNLLLRSKVGNRTWSYVLQKLSIETRAGLIGLLKFKGLSAPTEALGEALDTFTRWSQDVIDRVLSNPKRRHAISYYHYHRDIGVALPVMTPIELSQLRARLIKEGEGRSRLKGVFGIRKVS